MLHLKRRSAAQRDRDDVRLPDETEAERGLLDLPPHSWKHQFKPSWPEK